MADLSFDFEWIDPAGAAGPELRATWARLAIAVGDVQITKAIDHTSRSVRSSIYLPLYPLAEWLVTRWWFLLHELQPHNRTDVQSYEKRHSLRNAGDGFALPAVSIAPTGSFVRIEWTPVNLPHQFLDFTERGSDLVDTESFKDTVLRFATTVVKRLHDCEIRGTLLEQELEAITTIPADEREFCAAAAALGLDPFAVPEREAALVVSVAERLPESVTNDFFAVADVHALGAQAQQVIEGIEATRSNQADLRPLKDLKGVVTASVVRDVPWVQGYRAADVLRERLGMNGVRLNSISSLSTALRLPEDEFRKSITPVISTDFAVDVVVAANRRQSPAFAVRRRAEPPTLFALCRALFEYLATPGDTPLLITRARSDRQKRNRAFAAEFLVPAATLRGVLTAAILTNEDVDDLADEFGVSSAVIRHQIENHRLARIVNR